MKTERCPVISKNGTVLIPIRWKRAKKIVKEGKGKFVVVSKKNTNLLKKKLGIEDKIYPNTEVTKNHYKIVYLKLKYDPENVDIEKK